MCLQPSPLSNAFNLDQSTALRSTLVLGAPVFLTADATGRGAHLISLSLSLNARHVRSGVYRSRFILMYTYELRLESEKQSFGAPGASTGGSAGVCMMVEGRGRLDYGLRICDRECEAH